MARMPRSFTFIVSCERDADEAGKGYVPTVNAICFQILYDDPLLQPFGRRARGIPIKGSPVLGAEGRSS